MPLRQRQETQALLCRQNTPPPPWPASTATLLKEALQHHHSGRLGRAVAMYRQILTADPSHADATHLLGLCLHQQGRSLDAYELIKRALHAHPNNAIYLNNIGEVCRALGRLEEAIEYFTRALDLSQGEFREAHRNLGRAYLDAGHMDRAQVQLEETIRRYPDDPETYCALTDLHSRQKRYADALATLDAGLASVPMHPRLLCLKGIILRGGGDIKAAIAHYEDAVAHRPDVAELHHNQGLLYQQMGEIDQAIVSFERELSISPNETAHHLLAALRGHTTERAPARYIRETFDAYANQFDAHLVDKLEYRTPDLLAKLIAPELHDLDILDMGCGTGLMGVALRARKRRLVGLDLSPRMIDKARARMLYDDLIVGDLLDWLAKPRDPDFNLVVAADVFNYLGDLTLLFQRMANVLRPGGYLLFSIETARIDTGDYVLDATGRYQHRAGHIYTLATAANLVMEKQVDTSLRREKGVDVAGTLFLFRYVPT